jgi:CheY-like chemotaxis protein
VEFAGSGSKVLLVDDQLTNRKLLQRTLENLGVETASIEVAPGGMQAVELVRRSAIDRYVRGSTKEALEERDAPAAPLTLLLYSCLRYALIFMDHEMPEMNGSEAARAIRALGYMGRLVGLTGNAGKLTTEAFLECGLDSVITKPFRPGDIRSVL